MTAHQIVLTRGRIVDAPTNSVSDETELLISDGRIAQIASSVDCPEDAKRIDLGGRWVTPGLIDCHAHPFLADTNLSRLRDIPPTLMAARAASIMKRMLMRGFTTIRDAAGGDWGIKQAVEEGVVEGPRLFIAGRALSQTGGHGDMRARTDDAPCSCATAVGYLSITADGVDEVRKAVREQLRQGADQIKIMVSGGVSSPHDPLERDQYSPQEIRTIVEEAERRGTYVMAHAYGASAIRMAVECGVRTIEHGNLVDEDTAALMAEKGAYLVPTLVTYSVLADTAAAAGWSDDMLAKLDRVRGAGLASIQMCRAAGVKIGFGTDLLGDSFDNQSREFLVRSEIETPAQILTSATHVNAEILNRSGELGVVAEGAIADLLVLDRNPLEDVHVFQDQGAHMPAIIKQGHFFKNTLIE